MMQYIYQDFLNVGAHDDGNPVRSTLEEYICDAEFSFNGAVDGAGLVPPGGPGLTAGRTPY